MSNAGHSNSVVSSGTITPRHSISGSIGASISRPASSTSNTGSLTSSSTSAISLRTSIRSGLPRSNSSGTAGSNSNRSAAPSNPQSRRRSRVLDRFKIALSWPAFQTLLHSTGLKLLSYKNRYKGPNGQEVPKPVLSKSWALALFSLGTHVLPTMITIFLITFNARVMINGPPISVPAAYVLQGASKLHVCSQSALTMVYVLIPS